MRRVTLNRLHGPCNSGGKHDDAPGASLSGGTTYNVTASYSGDSNYISSSGTASGTAQQDFSIAATPSSFTVTAGQSAVATIAITALGGFNGAIAFTPTSCVGLPSAATCSFSPASVSGSGNTVLTVSTSGTVAGLKHRNPFRGYGALLAAFLSAVVVIPSRRRWQGLVTLVAIATLCASCGGGGSGSNSTTTPHPATPSGTYTITVTATSGTTTHSTIVTLTVS